MFGEIFGKVSVIENRQNRYLKKIFQLLSYNILKTLSPEDTYDAILVDEGSDFVLKCGKVVGI